ncbi:MAG: TonB-dependent receptor [Acidobacteria bacterium]|nr:TonB-dependent receptor [Acidobacteriota bacterium]
MNDLFSRGARRRLALVIPLLFAALASTASAQNIGTVTGVIRDAQGLPVPGVSVNLLNRVSQASQDTVSDSSGKYTLANIPFGIYVLSATLEGFTPAQQVVDIHSTVAITADLQLRIGSMNEVVEVSADALLETSSTGSHVDLGANLIDQLPSATPSKALSAMLLSAPGFIPSQNGRIHVRGSHGQIQYVVDGVPMTDEYTEAFANPLDPRYVKSAAVMTGGIPAEYGGKLAAVVDITSKSGLDDPRKARGEASVNVGRFGAVDGGATVGGRITPNIGYFLSAGANRTDRYLDPPTRDNLHNSGDAHRVTGKLELKPSNNDFMRLVFSANGSHFQAPNRPEAELRGEDPTQTLRDNSQTVTWLRQLGTDFTLDVVAYRRSASAALDARTTVPLAATQDRSLDHQGVNAALSYASGKHRVKGGVQYDRNPVREQFFLVGNGTEAGSIEAQFDPVLGGRAFTFSGDRVGQNLGAFIQDTFSPVEDLNLSVGVRVDRYKLLIERSAVSPRLGIAYHVHQTGTVLRGSYSRLFMPPFSENLLLSSSAQARALSPNPVSGEDVQPETQHAFEAGVQQAIGTHLKVDLAYYRKDIRNVADVDQFLDTTVTFPLSVAKGLAQGVEARVDVPVYKGINGYASVARAKILLTAPLTGGLFLGETPPAGEQFYADHDQRWQSQLGVSYEHPSQKFFVSFTGRVDSGIPFDLPEGFDAATFADPKALTLVNLATGRAKARTLADLMVGSQVYARGTTKLELQAGVLNVFDTTYLLNFLSIFNGTHYGAPRTWTTRLKVSF